MTVKHWIVVGDNHGPAYHPFQHLTEEAAFNEAERLARSNPGKFSVYELKGASAKRDVVTVRLSEYDQIPF